MLRIVLSNVHALTLQGDHVPGVPGAVLDPFNTDGAHWRLAQASILRAQAHTADTVLLTQNPAALDALLFDSADQVRERLWRWDGQGEAQRISADEAESVWLAYEANEKTVSEILSEQGLW